MKSEVGLNRQTILNGIPPEKYMFKNRDIWLLSWMCSKWTIKALDTNIPFPYPLKISENLYKQSLGGVL